MLHTERGDRHYTALFSNTAMAHRLGRTHDWVVKDGEEALDFIFAQGQYSDRSIEDAPKVILLDMHLPKIDGLNVLERIKSDARTQNIPVVVFSASPEEHRIVTSYNLGVNGYVLKPIDFDKDLDAVKEIGLSFSGCIKDTDV